MVNNSFYKEINKAIYIDVQMKQWYSKKPCLYKNCTFSNEVHHQGLGRTMSWAKCCPGSDDALSWKLCDFHMGMGSCFYPMTCKKHQDSHAEIGHFCTHYYSAWIVSWTWDNRWPYTGITEFATRWDLILDIKVMFLYHKVDYSHTDIHFDQNMCKQQGHNRIILLSSHQLYKKI